ncbi:MxaK protein [Aquabacterium sp.]|uniref:MxaK protein n=1 Tax=Aquabacterium sp. TaxID=1872578 RepID=UPI002B7C98EF|nr:MxaK protein [Aquabacterium sp.]HSW06973.1 MxaK protein [Aquabacterium sp.]
MGLALNVAQQRTRRVWIALAVLVLVAAVDATHTWRVQRLNALIESGQVPPAGPAPAADAAPQLQFAQAHALATSGSLDVALSRYQALHTDASLRQAARFNSANLLLRQAQRVRAGPQPGQAIPLIELAKELYRELLRDDPAHWDARYNLERAQRLLPDPEEAEEAPAAEPRNAERAVTTMRGHSPGLP